MIFQRLPQGAEVLERGGGQEKLICPSSELRRMQSLQKLSHGAGGPTNRKMAVLRKSISAFSNQALHRLFSDSITSKCFV